MSKFRKKPVVIEAVQLTWETWNEVCDFVGDFGNDINRKFAGAWVDPEDGGRFYLGAKPPLNLSLNDAEIGLEIYTLEGVMQARQGDWIIKGVQGEFYPCKPDIFDQTYEALDE